MPKFSVKKPLTVFVAVLAIVVLGVVAYLKMTPDLMPNMDFPYVILVTTDPGASPETVEADITKPLEQSMATLDRIKNVTSSSMDSVSMVVLEFEDGVNMDTVSVDIQQKINQLKGSWSDTVGDPYVLKMNPSMLPVQVAALSYDGKDITQLSDFVNDTLSPKLEGITGVASVTVSGTVERQLHVILSQKKLDALSQRLSDAIAKQLDDAAGQLASARGQVNSQGCYPQRRGIRRPGRRDPGPYHHSGQSENHAGQPGPAPGQPPGAGGYSAGEGPAGGGKRPVSGEDRGHPPEPLHDGGGKAGGHRRNRK